MRLILIRHGQTPSNVKNLLDTAVPGPGLTALGERQAAAVPGALAGEPLRAIYVSTLTRTALTAGPLAAARGLEPNVRAGLREISAGNLELKGDLPSIMAYLETVKAWLSGDLSARMPGADTGHDVLDRFDAVVREAEEQYDGGPVAMVSHGAMIRFWAGHRAGTLDWTNPKYHELSNTGIVIMEGAATPALEPGGWRVAAWSGFPAGGLAGTDTDGPTAELTADSDGGDDVPAVRI
ncbi:histidine phosphatase family protein [Specibacter cremeus]|uniref:histidine phosphatase family protein n=1 Tax=Specibacter cremeus TaxID=1629051 RepID=UPI000F7AD130|nr:histidine phosphatase family protein [Specibacter cremeus]